MNDTFLQACQRSEHTAYTPVWFMRPGRPLSATKYRSCAAKVSFLELCKTPELAAEVTLQPIELFGFDAAILFSDILIPMEAMNLDLEFHEVGADLRQPGAQPKGRRRVDRTYPRKKPCPLCWRPSACCGPIFRCP